MQEMIELSNWAVYSLRRRQFVRWHQLAEAATAGDASGPAIPEYIIHLTGALNMQVEELMSKSVQCCEAGDSLELAAERMWNHDFGCLPVCDCAHNDERRTIGVITDRDICMCALFQRKPLSELRVGEAMAKQVLACSTTDPLQQAESVMRRGRVRRLPVLNAEGVLVGMISLADLAREATRDSSEPAPTRPPLQVGDTLAAICAPTARAQGQGLPGMILQ